MKNAMLQREREREEKKKREAFDGQLQHYKILYFGGGSGR